MLFQHVIIATVRRCAIWKFLSSNSTSSTVVSAHGQCIGHAQRLDGKTAVTGGEAAKHAAAQAAATSLPAPAAFCQN
ncbi:MAG: hypothetical protein ACTHLO_05175 [Pseudolabrys sp.]